MECSSHLTGSQARKNSRRGQAVLEYVLLIVVAVTMSITFMRFFNDLINREGIPRFNAVLESELRTTQLPNNQHLTIWQN